MSDNDDITIGRILSRREVLSVLGAAGAAAFTPGIAGCKPRSAAESAQPIGSTARAMPGCVVRPAQEEGPYFVDERLDRADIRTDPGTGARSEGTPLQLAFQLSRVSTAACVPLAGALVDVWQCDANGVYAGVLDQDGLFDSRGKKFLRGFQRTDANGRVEFTTIWPGWYPGRAVHIHFKIRTDPDARRGNQFVSQLYFDDAVTDRVHAAAPYNAKGQRDRRNDRDGIFNRQNGRDLILAAEPTSGGYRGTFEVGLQI